MMGVTEDKELRSRALAALKKKHDFRSHVVAYVVINAMVIGIWAVTGAGFFWPVFPILGWGVGVILNGWDVYSKQPSEQQVQREIDRLR
ncbi:MAG TPA: 2TM domain-containing protein [Actinomycetota bacterium]|nr:2TM domain-containing protein [Actinomycetota bacterium]